MSVGGMSWTPILTELHHKRPDVGCLIASMHGVWRVTAADDVELTADEEEQRAERGGLRGRFERLPYLVRVEHVDGHLPPEFKEGKGHLRVGYNGSHSWYVYTSGRYPRCSCCGEPMPCRAEVEDKQVEVAFRKIERLESRKPGQCWACSEDLKPRQDTVTYWGANLDHPAAHPPEFHTRASCVRSACRYEERWLAEDPRRPRVLTWPKCGGAVIVHHDGSSECEGGDPNCGGRDTHDHGTFAACYAKHREGCQRGCPTAGHPGCGGRGRRPKRPRPLSDPLDGCLPLGETAIQDNRETCPGDLVNHRDGSTECIAGGRHDCWGGDTYRHAKNRDCATFSAGCPRCETCSGV